MALILHGLRASIRPGAIHSARSVEVWLRTTNTSATLAQWGADSSGNHFYRLRLAGAYAVEVALGGPVFQSLSAPYSLVDGAWHQLVVTYDGVTLVLYVDGRVASAATPSAALATSASSLFIAGGTFDELAVYPVALTHGQVFTHYTAAQAGLRSQGAFT
jgi:hypothetical protein